MNKNATLLVTSLVLVFQGSVAKAEVGHRVEAYEISKQAYIYAFPMIAGYKAMNEFTAFGAIHKKELDSQTNPAWPLATSNFSPRRRLASTR